ncbi:MAG: RidA family protein [Clostridia bacterium]|nr:RidA family protein [Clostridia bacterium]MCI1958259.1 RidA family protein [Clostridia bacterium]MCI2001287.1 RidA family protein [Clostridia bacterium]MCI2015962.1 RidA family protein [Clostridia bacterium]
MLKFTSTDKAPAAIGPYSQAVEANGFLFTSGQVALMPGTGEIVGTTIEEQAERVCQSLKAILDANGIGFENVVKTTCFLADMNDFGKFNEVYGKYFTSKPARSCVAVKTLPKNLLCEVEVVAAMK